MNEILFLTHILLVLVFLGAAVRLGKEALIAFVSLTGVLANLFVVKQTMLFGLHVTCSDVCAIGGILGLNRLQALFGAPAAKRAVTASLLALLFFASMSQMHLLYSPSAFDGTHGAFAKILDSSPRIIGASIVVYYVVQRFDVLFFGYLKRVFSNLALRLLASLFVSQAIDTILFSFLGLYGIVESLFDIILVSYIVKCSVIACGGPIAALFKRISRQEAV